MTCLESYALQVTEYFLLSLLYCSRKRLFLHQSLIWAGFTVCIITYHSCLPIWAKSILLVADSVLWLCVWIKHQLYWMCWNWQMVGQSFSLILIASLRFLPENRAKCIVSYYTKKKYHIWNSLMEDSSAWQTMHFLLKS